MGPRGRLGAREAPDPVWDPHFGLDASLQTPPAARNYAQKVQICPESANCRTLPLYLQNDVSWAPGGAWVPERRGIQYGTHSALGASRLKSGAVCLLIAVLTLFPRGCP